MDHLQTFLNLHKAEKGGEYTHTSMGPPFKGKFYVSQIDLSQFYKIYNKIIESGKKLHLTEKHKDVSPIVIDIDFRFPSSEGTDRHYSKEHIRKIVSYYQSEILDHFDGNATAFVYEKGTKGRLVKTRIKDGIHIMFPYIVTDPMSQLVMRRRIVKRIKEDNVFGDLKLSNDEWDIFDEKVIDKNPWTMYGSCKTDDENVYKITHVFDNNMEERAIPETKKLIEILSLRNKSQDDQVEYKNEESKKIYNNLYQQWFKNKKSTVSTVFDTVNVDVNKIKQLVDMLDSRRADDYEDWTQLGWCLHNISPGLLNVWEEFSKKSDKYEEGKCSEVWNKARNDGGLNMASLYYWAKHDSPEEYKKFKTNRVYEEILKSLSQATDYSIARVLHMMFGHKYVLASLKDKCWYEFISKKVEDGKTIGLRWKPCEQGIFLRKRISNDLYEAYREAEKKWTKWYDGLGEEEMAEHRGQHEERHTQFSLMYRKLNTTKSKNDIMKAAEELFYYDDRFDKKFLEKLDSNRDLIGFENGIYDLGALRIDKYGNVLKDSDGNELKGVFREGKPNDYVSLSTRINYIPYDDTSEEVYRCKKFMEDIFPDEEIRFYILTLLAYCLSGHISEEKFWMFIGQSSNGKSAVLELYKHAFGDYFQTVSPKILTTRRNNPEGASPEIAKLKGARFVAISEPEKDDVIQGGFTKLISGGDDVSCRKLYKDSINYKPQFTLVLLSNYFLKINTTDDGIFRRLRAVECKVKFCDNPEEDNEYQKQIDRSLKDNFPNWAEAFMSILIEWYVGVYAISGLQEPDEVKIYTRQYQQSVDDILEYVNENITESSGNILSLSAIYTHFKNWIREQTDTGKAPTRKELRKSLEKKFGSAKKTKAGTLGWIGINLVDNEEEELEGEGEGDVGEGAELI